MVFKKNWIGEHFDTPDKARTTLSNIALGGGILGFVLILIGLFVAYA